MKHGYAAERISGRWIWSEATQDEDNTFCHSGNSTWKMRSSGLFFDTLEQVELFCFEENG